MTVRVFLPDYGSLPTAHGHRPMSTLYQGEDLKLCFYRHRAQAPIPSGGEGAAVSEARAGEGCGPGLHLGVGGRSAVSAARQHSGVRSFLADRVLRILEEGRTVTSDDIATRLDRSPRTVYRYTKELRAQGVPVRGAAGIGFMLAKARTRA